MPGLTELRVKIFADGADLADFATLLESPLIAGVTTNPTLMRKAGVRDYAEFGEQLVRLIPHLPVSFEVFADDPLEMTRQARQISSWGDNVFVKIPITNTHGESCANVAEALALEGVRVNVTACLTSEQVAVAAAALAAAPCGFVSLFAGRIADSGRDPVPIVREAVSILSESQHLELIWASPRELYNLFQADGAGCHVITLTRDLLARLSFVGRDLLDISLDTVRMFHHDARAAGYMLDGTDVRATTPAGD